MFAIGDEKRRGIHLAVRYFARLEFHDDRRSRGTKLASGDIIKRRLYFHFDGTSGHREKSNGRNLSRIVRSKRIDRSARCIILWSEKYSRGRMRNSIRAPGDYIYILPSLYNFPPKLKAFLRISIQFFCLSKQICYYIF